MTIVRPLGTKWNFLWVGKTLKTIQLHIPLTPPRIEKDGIHEVEVIYDVKKLDFSKLPPLSCVKQLAGLGYAIEGLVAFQLAGGLRMCDSLPYIQCTKGNGLNWDIKTIRESRQPGRGYPVLVFHPGLSENAKEQVAIAGYSGRKYSAGGHLSFLTLLEASENRIWLIKLPAKGVNFILSHPKKPFAATSGSCYWTWHVRFYHIPGCNAVVQIHPDV